MNWGRLIAMARKELIQIRRDPRSLLIALLMPIMQMVMLGYGVSLDAKHIPVYAYDQEGSPDSQALLKHFQASQYFDLVKTVPNYRQLTRAIDSDRCRLGVVIPYDFSKTLRDRGTARVQVIVDGTDDNTANLAVEYARAVISAYSGAVQLDWMGRQGLATLAGSAADIDRGAHLVQRGSRKPQLHHPGNHRTGDGAGWRAADASMRAAARARSSAMSLMRKRWKWRAPSHRFPAASAP